nr:hypothetical protein [Candidatus Njordarchaeota archaeon]
MGLNFNVPIGDEEKRIHYVDRKRKRRHPLQYEPLTKSSYYQQKGFLDVVLVGELSKVM